MCIQIQLSPKLPVVMRIVVSWGDCIIVRWFLTWEMWVVKHSCVTEVYLMTVYWTNTCFGLWWPSSGCLGGNLRSYCFPQGNLNRPKHVVVQYIVIKLHLSDTVVFDYPHFPSSHTCNGDDTIPSGFQHFEGTCRLHFCHLLGVICPAACETYQQLEFPSNGLWTKSRVSPLVGLLPLACGEMKYMR